MENRNLSTSLSYCFRTAIGLHFTCLCVLFFGIQNTLLGAQHCIASTPLTLLIVFVAVLFVADMVTRKDEGRKRSKLIDGAVGSVWVAIVVFLFMNSLGAGTW